MWQLAPRISLRAWTLRDDPAGLQHSGFLCRGVSRQVVWATYDNPGGLRFDAIVKRGAGLAPPAVDLDADVVVPLLPGTALNAGSSRRDGVRRYFLGLRLQ